MNDFPALPLRDGFLDAIGNTPLIKLKAASEETGCTILGKAEFLNPGGSVKDRAALAIVEKARREGLIQPGATIVEGTAGNTGIGITLVANAMGYKSLIAMPKTQSDEKKQALRLFGATLVETEAKPFSDPGNYVKVSQRLAEEMNAEAPGSAFWANQFDNVANKEGHVATTGPEIWRDTNGKVDGFICAVGSGGTLAGVGEYLKEQNKDIKIGLADPDGARLHGYYTTGELSGDGGSVSEGIGQGRITENLVGFTPDFSYNIPDNEAIPLLYPLLKDEALCMGGSTAINIAGAIRMAKDMGPGHTIVTILCDHGSRYASKLYNPAWLAEKGMPIPEWLQA